MIEDLNFVGIALASGFAAGFLISMLIVLVRGVVSVFKGIIS